MPRSQFGYVAGDFSADRLVKETGGVLDGDQCGRIAIDVADPTADALAETNMQPVTGEEFAEMQGEEIFYLGALTAAVRELQNTALWNQVNHLEGATACRCDLGLKTAPVN